MEISAGYDSGDVNDGGEFAFTRRDRCHAGTGAGQAPSETSVVASLTGRKGRHE
jgi:hypothetical protein